MKLWPFHRKSKVPETDPVVEEITLSENALWLTWAPAQRVVLSIEELKKNFHITDEHIVEFAPKELSKDPQFQDEFNHLSHQLQSLQSGPILKLMDFGFENGRLFRMWENRRIHAASFEPRYSAAERSRRLLDVVEGFQLLRSIGLSVEHYRTDSISSDHQGFFIARFPFRVRDRPPGSGILTELLTHVACKPQGFTQLNHFLLELGTFISVLLFKTFPYQDYPHKYLQVNQFPRRVELNVESPLVDVVHRLTDLDPNKGYGSLDEALQALKEALAAHVQQC